MWNKVQETVKFLKNKGITTPDYGIILGTGLGNLVEKIAIEITIPYAEIPNFPVSTVEGHSGELIFGVLGGKKVLAMRGRFHYYEGWTMEQTIFPVRVMKFLGVEKLIVSNASGGVNPAFKVGDIMLITDHINFMPEHPLHGKNDTRFGPRFVDMHEAYSKKMIAKMEQVAEKMDVKVHKGIYLALQGPTFETPAEYKMVKILGADAVGMSTVPEVIVAKHMGMECFGVSVITDLGVEGIVEAVSHEEVQEVAKISEKVVGKLVEEFVKL
ncbi:MULTISPECIES: purine-nucleoside phosphorylase [Flavobacteriaceae]|uniref:Purine nucleoside phosphorylase n=2 Tax=Flavobacteriaceae TaxID=49546 RepID=A0A4Y8AQP0_9FLAO|nr:MULTISPECIES: purine-nucleoside phosphorylase [Flavobacteriaceae]TEW72154.1 purine-nucleoside phosphorylase [Gramella jeungdoensis]GGK56832.1 purine nucleoside phosphorylase [Lutibacter litoralis]